MDPNYPEDYDPDQDEGYPEGYGQELEWGGGSSGGYDYYPNTTMPQEYPVSQSDPNGAS
jgi:hypothetical protein